MPFTVPQTIFPTEERFVNVARESAGQGQIPASSGTTFPIINFEPDDKPIWLPNESLYGDMAGMHDMQQGPRVAETSIGGNVFVDMIGHEFYNILGDYQQTATTATPTATTSTALAPGATAITVASGGASFTVGMQILITDAVGGNEIVTAAAGATATSIPLNAATPIRLAHLTALTINNTTVAAGTYSHIFSLLNSSAMVGTGWMPQFGQGPTHVYTDRTQVPATGLARQYAYSCFSELTITGNAEKLLEWSGSFTSFVGQIASTPPVASVSGVRVQPDYRTAIGLLGTVSGAQIFNISEWAVTIQRQVEPFFDNDQSQNPYVIGRGKLDVTGKLTFSPATDETALLYMLNNTQPQLQIQASNGGTAAAFQQVQIDILFADFDTSKIQSGRSLFGYEVTFKASSTATTLNGVALTGWSGGTSPIKVTVNNLVPVY
jgi:hypothetical protein